ncbi:MAG: dienelactone hydrolase family protein [Verrucomicrobiota bacterium]
MKPSVLTLLLLLVLPVSAPAQDEEKKKPVFNGRMITLSDFGSEDLGYLSLPQRAPVGGLVLVSNQWGLNVRVKKLADDYARQGYVTVAVDLFNGKQAKNKGEADRYMKELRAESAVKTTLAGARVLKESPKFKVPYVGLVGIGIGGSVALEAAKQDRDGLVNALGMIEGPLSLESRTLDNLRVPTLAVFAEGNAQIPRETFTNYERLLKGRNRDSQVVLLQAAPGFSEPTSPAYNRQQDLRAFSAVNSFMPAYLDKPPPEPGLIDEVKDKFQSIFD